MSLVRSKGTQDTIRTQQGQEARGEKSLTGTYPFNHVARQVLQLV